MIEYILADDGKTPISTPNVVEWGEWFETADRVVRQDTIDVVKVSTVFLGIDHNFGECNRPILWETMVFGGKHCGDCKRYSTYDEAVAGHENMVQLCREEE